MTYNHHTTLNRIWEAKPRAGVLEKLLTHLGKTTPDNEPLSLLTVLDINGLDDAEWVLTRAMPDNRLARHYRAACAERVLHLYEALSPGDDRIRAQIEMLRNDDATDEERRVARDAARAAARAAAEAFRAATAAHSAAAHSAAARAAYATYTARAASAAERRAQEQILRSMIKELT